MASGTMPADEMPVMREPYDVMRNGLQGAKSAVTHLGKHPVQLIQDNGPTDTLKAKHAMLANTYGIAMPAKMDIECQILSKQRRLPGLPSSRLGLEIMTGDVDRFGFESYLDRPDEQPEAPRGDLHSAMENRLGLNKKPGYGPGSKR